ncbi:hypothetical protein LINPERPRIM_LOCUS20821, partial [Linum perenne]
EIREPRPPLQRHASDLREPSGDDLRRYGVAVSDEDVSPRLSLCRVAWDLASQRRRRPVELPSGGGGRRSFPSGGSEG